MAFPGGLINLVKAIYFDACAVMWDSDLNAYVQLFTFASGVLQGCPASAFLFNLSLDPFLFSFQKRLEENRAGILRACADDIGASLRALRHLALLAPIFQLAKKLAGLSLKPSKCVLIPLAPLTLTLETKIRQWLEETIPTWMTFRIQNKGKYLGFFLGPEANSAQWNGPLEKYTSRVDAIYASHAAISISSYSYNTRAVPVVSYVAQLVTPPPRMQRLELTSLNKIAHMATNALYLKDFLSLEEAGGPQFRSVAASMRAAMLRTACQTVTVWPEWQRQLQVAAEESLPFSRWMHGVFYPDFWDAPAFASNLRDAFDCRFEHKHKGKKCLWSEGAMFVKAALPAVLGISPRYPTFRRLLTNILFISFLS